MSNLSPAVEPSTFSNMELKDFSHVYVHNVVDGTCEEQVAFSVVLTDCNTIIPVTMPCIELDKYNFRIINSRIRFSGKISAGKANRNIADFIKERLCDKDISTQEKYRIDKVGLFKVKDEAIFCLGNEVVTSYNGNAQFLEFDTQGIASHFNIDSQMNESDAIRAMFTLICCCRTPGAVITAQQITYILRQAYVDAGLKPCLCVVLYGETGKMKTTFSSYMTQLYNRADGIKSPVRLNASLPSAISIISEARDCVVVLDDLFPADSTEIRRKQEETFSEIVRCIGDGTTPAKMHGKSPKSINPLCGVLFTGEYFIGQGSDAARIVPIEMEDINGEQLKFFQDNPLIVSTFFRNFIQWAIDNYKEIVDFLVMKLNEYRSNNIDIHRRLQDTLYYLDTSYFLLLSYCCEKDFFSDSEAKTMHKAFLKKVIEIIRSQDQRVGKKIPVADTTVDYWEYIRSCYKAGKIFYAENCNEYQDGVHYAVIYTNYLCIRKEWFEESFPNNEASEIAASLYELGVLEKGKKSYSKQISKLNGKRFYFIRLEELNN